MDEKFSSLLSRLETVTTRLESMEVGGSGAGAAPSAKRPAAAATDAAAPSSASVSGFDQFVRDAVRPWVAAAEAVGPATAAQAKHVLAAVDAQRRFLECAAACAKPADEEMPMLLVDTSKAIGEAQQAVDRRSADYNCLNAVGEGIAALGWVVVTPKPVPHIEEMHNSSDFYGNKVLMQHRNEPADASKLRVAFVQAWQKLLKELVAYVKEHHRTGVSWKPNGTPVTQYSAGRSAAAPAKAGAPPPPPPPPPPPAPGASAAAPPAGGMSDVFSQLNAGTSVTAGLRHVKKGDVTAPAAPVAAAKAAASARPAPAAAAASKPARTALEGKKWMVEYHKNDPSVTVQGSLKETVYVYKCEGSTIAVRGKVNAITLDGCKKTAILVESAMAGVELVNCSGCKVQVTGTVATISVDKCDGTQLILSRDATSADIISAKSSELNIIVPGASEDDEYKEHAIAEQFISKYVDGKFVTTAVEHTA